MAVRGRMGGMPPGSRKTPFTRRTFTCPHVSLIFIWINWLIFWVFFLLPIIQMLLCCLLMIRLKHICSALWRTGNQLSSFVVPQPSRGFFFEIHSGTSFLFSPKGKTKCDGQKIAKTFFCVLSRTGQNMESISCFRLFVFVLFISLMWKRMKMNTSSAEADCYGSISRMLLQSVTAGSGFIHLFIVCL